MIPERLHVGRRYVSVVPEADDGGARTLARGREPSRRDRVEEAKPRANLADVVTGERVVIGGARERAGW